MNTIALDGDWDVFLDASNNLAIRTGGSALAQDVASATRTFRGECWYDGSLGILYYQDVLGQRVNLQLFKQQLATEGQKVPQVSAVKVFLTGPGPGPDRRVGGQLQVYSNGQLVSVAQVDDMSGTLPWWVNPSP